MKILIRVLLMVFLVLTMVTSTRDVSTNAGPPANVEIEIINIDVAYYFDLLIQLEEPLSNDAMDAAWIRIEDIRSSDYPSIYYTNDFPEQLVPFQDADNYASNTLYGEVDYFYSISQFEGGQSNRYRLWLGVPRIFKIVIVTEHETIITSERIEMDQFDFRLTYDLEGVDLTSDQFSVGTTSGFVGNPWTNPSTIFNFLLRVIFTILVEIGILFLFGFRKKRTFVFVTLMNVITQSLLTLFTIMAFYATRYNAVTALFITFIIGEFFVFIVEGFLVGTFVKEKALWYRLLYVLVANTVTIIFGLFLIEWFLFLL